MGYLDFTVIIFSQLGFLITSNKVVLVTLFLPVFVFVSIHTELVPILGPVCLLSYCLGCSVPRPLYGLKYLLLRYDFPELQIHMSPFSQLLHYIILSYSFIAFVASWNYLACIMKLIYLMSIIISKVASLWYDKTLIIFFHHHVLFTYNMPGKQWYSIDTYREDN